MPLQVAAWKEIDVYIYIFKDHTLDEDPKWHFLSLGFAQFHWCHGYGGYGSRMGCQWLVKDTMILRAFRHPKIWSFRMKAYGHTSSYICVYMRIVLAVRQKHRYDIDMAKFGDFPFAVRERHARAMSGHSFCAGFQTNNNVLLCIATVMKCRHAQAAYWTPNLPSTSSWKSFVS